MELNQQVEIIQPENDYFNLDNKKNNSLCGIHLFWKQLGTLR